VRSFWQQKKRIAAALTMSVLTSICLVATTPAVAHAAPGCQEYLVINARGTTQKLHPWAPETYDFFRHVNYALGRGNDFSNVVQLGDLDGTNTGSDPANTTTHYPAALATYPASVTTGANELVNFLNDRAVRCPQEVKVIGGFSQGADAVGWAMERDGGGGYVSLSPAARHQIGYVALYGDVKYNSGSVHNSVAGNRPWWARGNSDGYNNHWCDGLCPASPNNGFQFYTASQGLLGARSPVYAREDLVGRLGSWCDEQDHWCNVQGPNTPGAHDSYKGDYGWIHQSAQEIATAAIFKRNQLNGVSGNARLVCDANGDGKNDAIVMFGDTGTAKVSLSNGSSFGYPGNWSYGKLQFASDYKCADVSGDGKADLIAYFRLSKTWFVSTSSGSGFWPPTEWAYDGSLVPDRTFFADVSGDGRADKVFYIGGNWWVGLSSGSGFWTPQQWISGHGIGSNDQFASDFNGDGKADAAVYFAASGNWHVGLSTGSSFGYPGQWSAGHGLGTSFRLVGDTTGDGKADMVYYSNNIYKYWVGSSSGGGFWGLSEWSYDGPGYNNLDNAFVADVTGDGKADKVLWFRGTGNWYVAASSGGGFWPLNLWVSGHGAGS